jgi:hypothetical protein
MQNIFGTSFISIFMSNINEFVYSCTDIGGTLFYIPRYSCLQRKKKSYGNQHIAACLICGTMVGKTLPPPASLPICLYTVPRRAPYPVPRALHPAPRAPRPAPQFFVFFPPPLPPSPPLPITHIAHLCIILIASPPSLKRLFGGVNRLLHTPLYHPHCVPSFPLCFHLRYFGSPIVRGDTTCFTPKMTAKRRQIAPTIR